MVSNGLVSICLIEAKHVPPVAHERQRNSGADCLITQTQHRFRPMFSLHLSSNVCEIRDYADNLLFV